MRLAAVTWVKLINRWSELPDCGEKRLICSLIAEAIVEEEGDFRGLFWTETFVVLCALMRLNSVAVLEAARRCREYRGKTFGYRGLL